MADEKITLVIAGKDEATPALQAVAQAISEVGAEAEKAKAETEALDAAAAGLTELGSDTARAVPATEALTAAQQKLLASIQRAADGVGKSRAELLSYKAAQAGISEQAEQYIFRLRAEEQAQKNTAASIKKTEAEAKALAAALRTVSKVEQSPAVREIKKVEEAMRALERAAKDTGKDYSEALASGRARIAALQQPDAAAPVSGVTGGLGSLKAVAGPLAGVLAGLFAVDRIARYIVEVDNLHRSFVAVTGSAGGAARELAFVTATANRLGIEVGAAGKAYAGLLAAARGTPLEGEPARRVFESVASAMSKLGRDSSETEGALLALQQMLSKGVVQAEEFTGQLAERIPGAAQATARELGLTTQGLQQMIQAGQVLPSELLPALAAGLEKSFAGQKDNVRGFAAEWTAFTNAVSLTIGEFGQMEGVSSAFSKTLAGARYLVAQMGFQLALTIDLLGRAGKASADVAFLLTHIPKSLSEARENFAQYQADLKRSLTEPTPLVKKFAEEMAKAAGEITGMAQTAQDSGGKLKTAASGTEALAQSTLKLRLEAIQAGQALEKQEKNQERALENVRLQNQATQALVASTGTQVEIAQAAVQAQQAELQAAVHLADTKRQQAEAAQRLASALKQQLAAQTEALPQQKQMLDNARAEAEAKTLEADKSRLLVQQMGAELEKRQTAVTLARDNAASVAQFRQELDAANAALKNAGNDGDAYARAQSAQVQATLRYRDALSDLVSALGRVSDAQKRQGDLLKQQQAIALQQLDIEAARAENAGQQDRLSALAIDKARLLAQQKGQLAKQAAAELEAEEKLAAAKVQEVEASAKSAEQKQAEIAAIKDGVQAKALAVQADNLAAEQAQVNADKVIAAERAKQGAMAETVSDMDDMAAASDRASKSTVRASYQAQLGIKLTDTAVQQLAQSWLGALPTTPVQAAAAEVAAIGGQINELRDSLASMPGEFHAAFEPMFQALQAGQAIASQRQAVLEAVANVDALGEAWFRAGGQVADTASAADFANQSLAQLDAADLSQLDGAVSALKSRFAAFKSQIDGALAALKGMGDSILENMLRQNGQLEALENLQYKKQLEQAAELRAKGGEAAEAEYQRTVQLLELEHQQALKNIKEQAAAKAQAEAEAQKNKLDAAAKQGATASELQKLRDAATGADAQKNQDLAALLSKINSAQFAGRQQQLGLAGAGDARAQTGSGPQQVNITFDVNASELLTEASIRKNIVPVLNNILRRGG